MDKLKFILLMLFFALVVAAIGWAGWNLFIWLGFWKSAFVILSAEFFFTARGAYLVAGVTEVYSEEIKALRLDGNFARSLGQGEKETVSDFGKRVRSNKGFLLYVLLVVAVGASILNFFGFWPCAVMFILCSQALIVNRIYRLRSRIVRAQTELEGLRLTLARNDAITQEK